MQDLTRCNKASRWQVVLGLSKQVGDKVAVDKMHETSWYPSQREAKRAASCILPHKIPSNLRAFLHNQKTDVKEIEIDSLVKAAKYGDVKRTKDSTGAINLTGHIFVDSEEK